MDVNDSKGIQYGQSNVQNNLFIGNRNPVSWPLRVGAVPRVADCFQPRTAELELAPAVDADRTGPSTLVLSGMGGAGKTQIAAHFARSRWDGQALDLLVWAEASSKDAIVSGYAQAANAICIDDGNDANRAADRFISWLEDTDKRWLVVLDDLASPDSLQNLWPPPASTGQTVVTTRRQDSILSSADRKFLIVDVFTQTESMNYLINKFGLESSSLIDADKLVADLGHLPLALAQAAAYMTDRELNCVDYRRRWNDRNRHLRDVMPEPGALPDDYHLAVAATWSLSVDFADRLSPQGLARPLLELASMMDANGIPVSALLSQAALAYITETCAASHHPQIELEDVEDALHNLRRLSLISIDSLGQGRRVRIHALAQRAIRENLPETRQRQAAQSAADALLEVWLAADLDRDLSQLLRANAKSIYGYAGRFLWSPRAHELILRAGSSLGESGLIDQAIPYWQDVYDSASTIFGQDHAHTLVARYNLIRCRGQAGDPAWAAAELRLLLTDQERVLGPSHPHSLTTRGNLARCLGEMGNVAGAVLEFERLLGDLLRLLGSDHPHTLITRGNLARARGEAGDATRAVKELSSLLEDQLRVLGANHPHTLTTGANLTRWQASLRKAVDAVDDFRVLLSRDLEILGPAHPHVLITRANLARLRVAAGDRADAEVDLRDLLNDQVRILGPDHPQSLATQADLGRLASVTDARSLAYFHESLYSYGYGYYSYTIVDHNSHS